MDYLRFGYRGKMQFKAGGPEVPVVWYRVPSNRPVFKGYHRFASLMWWNRERGGNPVGDVGGNYAWYRGNPPFPAAGDKPCGELSWFRDGAPPNAPNLPLGQDGWPMCCKRRAAGVVVGGEAMVAKGDLIKAGPGGVKVGGTAFWCGWHLPVQLSPVHFAVAVVGLPFPPHGAEGFAGYNPASDTWLSGAFGSLPDVYSFQVVCLGATQTMIVSKINGGQSVSFNETQEEPFFTSVWSIPPNPAFGIPPMVITLTK